MDLQTLLSGLYGVLGTYVIPTIIFLCVVVFLYNVIRFFIWQGGSEDGREKARRYLVWSMIGFVLIVSLWGIISLLLTTLDTTRYGGAIVCPDYDTTCQSGGSNPSGPNPGVGGSGTASGGFGTPPAPGPSGPGPVPGPITPGPSPAPTPGFPPAPSPGPTPGPGPGLTGGDYTSVGSSALTNLSTNSFGQNTFMYQELSVITSSGVLDQSKIDTAAAFTQAGVLTATELNQIVTDINSVRVAQGFQPLSLSSVTISQSYVQDIQEFYDDTAVAQQQISSLYQVHQNPTLPVINSAGQADSLATTDISSFYDTTVPLDQRVQAADALLSQLGSTALLNATLENAFYIEASRTSTPISFFGNNISVSF